jgi:hypothetical protein
MEKIPNPNEEPPMMWICTILRSPIKKVNQNGIKKPSKEFLAFLDTL